MFNVGGLWPVEWGRFFGQEGPGRPKVFKFTNSGPLMGQKMKIGAKSGERAKNSL
jgi:hypothetical protein